MLRAATGTELSWINPNPESFCVVRTLIELLHTIMTDLIPLASYSLRCLPGLQVPPIEQEFPITVRLTMAALDPLNPTDDKQIPSTLTILRSTPVDSEDEEEDEELEDDEEEEVDEDGVKFRTTRTVLCTLSPKTQFQQTLDLVVTPAEDVAFEVTGSYPIHLTGNYLEHPYDDESEDEEDAEGEEDEDDEEEDEDELDGEDYDQSPDEDELMGDRIREIVDEEAEEEEEDEEEESDDEALLQELIKQQQAERASAKKDKKRASSEPEPKAKKQKSEKKVEFSDDLEKISGASESKYPTKKLEGGVIIEDRTTGTGPHAKKGQTVGVRYIGKLKNGKVFDKNTSGKPFYFKLGKGEVIKGWDVGVQGMAVKGERRIIIPAPMAYGKQSLPGIPANSELTFDVKLVNIK